jgi:hypothetical protein
MKKITIILGFLLLSGVLLSFSGGPDDFGYRWVDSRETGGPAFEWYDISTTGTLIATSGSDDGFSTVSLPRAFEYYGIPYTTINETTNGAIAFGTVSYFIYYPTSMPYDDGTNNVVAAMWTDLYPSTAAGYGIKTQGFDDKFIIQWNKVQEIGYSTNLQTFQIVLYYGSRTIMINYLDVTTLSGRTAHIGIENATGTDGLLCGLFGTGGTFLRDSMSIRFRATPTASVPYFNNLCQQMISASLKTVHRAGNMACRPLSVPQRHIAHHIATEQPFPEITVLRQTGFYYRRILILHPRTTPFSISGTGIQWSVTQMAVCLRYQPMRVLIGMW